jgi:hypothetical protein
MPDATKSRFNLLTPNGKIPANTMCPFFAKCARKDERCFTVKRVDFSCALARGFDMFPNEEMGG